jgi:hypothetical protein
MALDNGVGLGEGFGEGMNQKSGILKDSHQFLLVNLI